MHVLYPGHRYELANLRDDGFQILQFQQDSPLHPNRPGTNCQEVIRALIDRVRVLDTELPWPGNGAIIGHLRGAITGFEMRALYRKMQKGLPIEKLPVGPDGHLIISQGDLRD